MKNHVQDIWACDFTVVNDWLFRPWDIFVVMELKNRRIVHTAVTRSPTDEWKAQQIREATSWGKGPKYLIGDRDTNYGPPILEGSSHLWNKREKNIFLEREDYLLGTIPSGKVWGTVR